MRAFTFPERSTPGFLSHDDQTDGISCRDNRPFRTGILALIILGLGILKTASAQTEFFVSMNGNDTSLGTQSEPFQHLERARDVLRQMPRLDQNVNVWIGQGEYFLTRQIDFDERDGGQGAGTVTYQALPGKEVVFSGGVRVTGWQRAENNLWKAPLDRGVKLRSLYVNGVRARMAGMMGLASRGGGFHVTAGQAPWAWSTGSKADCSIYTDLPMIHRNPDDVEITNFQLWNCNTVCVRDVVQDGNKVILKHQEPYGAISQTCYWDNFDAAGHHWVSNAYEFLKEPGQFYFDRSAKTLYYIPRAGEDMTSAMVVAPRLVHLMSIKGRDPGHPVRNLAFKGFHFAHSDWNLAEVDGSHGKASCQGACYFNAFTLAPNWHNDMYRNLDVPPGAIECEHCDHIQLVRNSLEHLAAEAVALPNDANHVHITGNVIRDVAGSAVLVGHPQHVFEADTPDLTIKDGAGVAKEKYPPGLERVCRSNSIDNNYIKDCTQEFFGEAAVSAFFVSGLHVDHNIIDHVSFNGVSLGWGWDNMRNVGGKATATASNNSISCNRFFDVMLRLNDSGAIYTLGAQPGTVVRGNYVKGVGGSEFPTLKRYGIHHDAGSAFITTTGNVLDIGPDIWSVHAFRWGSEHDVIVTDVYTTSLRSAQGGGSNKLSGYHFNPDNVWPLAAYEIILKSGIEPTYQDIVPESEVGVQDRVFPASVMVRPLTEVPIAPVTTLGKKVVLIRDVVSPSSSDIVQSIQPMSAFLTAPAIDGSYKVAAIDPSGVFHPSRGTLVVRHPSPSVKGVETGKTYDHPVTIHAEGSAILDGDESSVGTEFTVIKNGSHVLSATLANGEKTDIPFAIDFPQQWMDGERGIASGKVPISGDPAFPYKVAGPFDKESSLAFEATQDAKLIRIIYASTPKNELTLLVNGQKVGVLSAKETLVPGVGQIPTFQVAEISAHVPAGSRVSLQAGHKSVAIYIRAVIFFN